MWQGQARGETMHHRYSRQGFSADIEETVATEPGLGKPKLRPANCVPATVSDAGVGLVVVFCMA